MKGKEIKIKLINYPKAILCCGILIIFLSSLIFAQEENKDSLTFTTYYPSPHGVYRNLKLFPITSQPSGPASSTGVMYFDNNLNMRMIRYHNGTGWVNLTEPLIPEPQYWVLSGTHIYNNNTGFVGINTQNPQYELDVNGRIQADDVCDGSKCLSACRTSCPDCDSCCPSCASCNSCCPASPVCPACPASGCPSGQVCLPSNYVPPCPSGESCKGDCPASGCPSGQSCQPPCPTCPTCPGCASCCPAASTCALSCVQVYNAGSPPSCPSGYTQVGCLERFSSASSATSQGSSFGSYCVYWTNLGYRTAYSATILCCKAE